MKAGRDWDAYAAVIASFIGLLALGLSGYTAYVQRQQLRAQVWPHLSLWMSDTNLGFYLTNQGTGPARITAVRVTVDRTPVKTWSEATKAVGFTGEEWATSTLNGVVLPAGKDYTVIHPMDEEQNRTKVKKLLHADGHTLSVTLCYCSVLDECWVTSVGSGPKDGASSDASCSIAAAERFSN